jgi:hypothetical protein
MKAPFKVLYSNDLTHILTCVSPYHRRGEKFTRAMLEASVDETANTGIDVHMLQPGFTWVPMWQSKILPPAQHWKWLQKNYSANTSDSFLEYLVDGGDIVSDFTERCRQKSLTPFISLRMNDGHHLDRAWTDDIKCGQISVCEFYHNHPGYCLELEADLASWRDRVQNWAIPEVREYKFNLIKELCENYDIDGVELDFMRLPRLFRSYETTSEQRKEIICGFVARVRKLLDETAPDGQHRWLCLKIPANYAMLDSIGINIEKLTDIGVDMLNLSYGFYTAQNGDLALFREQAKNVALYVEMTHCAAIGRGLEKADGDNNEIIKTTNEQFYTTAASAYNAGLEGVSLFNFVYFREYGSSLKKAAVNEPPFEIIKNFRDREFLSAQPAHYFIGPHWGDDNSLPKCMELYGQCASFLLKNVYCQENAVCAELQVQLDCDSSNVGDWEAWFNARPVKKIREDLKKSDGVGKVMAWKIPPSLILEGDNRFEIRSRDLKMSVIDFIELITRR